MARSSGDSELRLPVFRDDRTAGQLGPATLGGVSVVIVTFNSAKTLRHCLDSVLPTLTENDEVIVVDNGSEDETIDIARSFRSRIGLIENGENLGFSMASNIGLRASRGQFVCLLNPDTIVRPGWLAGLLSRFDDSRVGAVGPVTDNVAGDQYIERHLGPSDGKWLTSDQLARRIVELHPNKSWETKLLIGFCVMFRRATLDGLGLLDEDLFLGGEDLEISLRLRSNGLKLLVARDVFVHHSGGVSFASVPSETTTRLLAESTEKLRLKLRMQFAPGPEPCSRELWGTPILPQPDLACED